MRRAQSSIEIVLALTLLCMLLAVAGLGALSSWRDAEVAVAGLAADRAASRGGDPQAAARAVLPPILHSALSAHQGVTR
ncbi:MAG: hypothetical protein NTX95_03105 [Actinobacteria bacterium]|nr:hypothetical protein [Actinomycetota bacterium]